MAAAPDKAGFSLAEGAYAVALRYLSYRARTVEEVAGKLAAKGFDSVAIAAVTASLSRDGYLDDARLAREVASSRVTNRRWGPARIRRELSTRGVAPEIIKDALAEYGGQAEIEAASTALKGWLKRNNLKPMGLKKDRKAIARAFRHLASRGFCGAAASAALKRAGAEVEAEESE